MCETIDDSKRKLYPVGLDDGIAADPIFTGLMSDSIEERRESIERHALEATTRRLKRRLRP